MLKNRILVIGCTLLATAFLVAACSSDSPTDPGGGNTDTTAPQVAGIDPTNGETEVAVDETIEIVFSEAIDPATAAGNITLSSGTLSPLTWTDDRTLLIDHSDWAEGAEVTVTVGTGLADVAGNTLAAAYTSSFYVFSSVLTVLEVNPADGATGVNRSSNIQILFSATMNEASILANTTITVPDTKANIPFTVDSEHSAITLVINETLPANTPVTVAMSAGLAAQSGATLGSPYSFSFTTGMDVDTTPPTVVSSSPANGSVMPADAGIFQVTFSEPMDPSSFEPSAWNVEFAILMNQIDPTPTWNNDNTVVTVPLPTPMPAGLPIEITFSGLSDANGNEISTPWTYEADVAGTANYYPAIDGAQFIFTYLEKGGDIGNTTPLWQEDGVTYLQVDEQSNGDIQLADYGPGFVMADGTYELYRVESDRVDWLGFREEDEGTLGAEILFDAPLKVLPLPLAAGNWTASTTVTIPGEGSLAATVTGTVTGKADLPFGAEFGGSLFYKDTYRVARRLEVRAGGTLTYVENDTTWYSPTLGPVEEHAYDEELDAGEWYHEISWRIYEFLN